MMERPEGTTRFGKIVKKKKLQITTKFRAQATAQRKAQEKSQGVETKKEYKAKKKNKIKE